VVQRGCGAVDAGSAEATAGGTEASQLLTDQRQTSDLAYAAGTGAANDLRVTPANIGDSLDISDHNLALFSSDIE
jgi:hypothetical protein